MSSPPVPLSANAERGDKGNQSMQLPRDAVLLVVDVQRGMDDYAAEYHRNNPDLEANIARLQAQ